MDEMEARQRAFILAHRRTGKDLLAWNILIRESQKRIGTYWHVLPLLNQARKIIWTGSTRDGVPFLDFIPPPLIASKRDDEMSIRLTNGSLIQLVGADRIDSLMGANPIGITLSEFALMKPSVWHYLSPILNENDGWAMFITTPRGRNHAFDLFKDMVDNNSKGAKNFVQVLTVDDTKKPLLDAQGRPMKNTLGSQIFVPVIPPEAIQEQRDLNIPEEVIQQEYYCSFEAGLVGAYYADAMSRVEQEHRIEYKKELFNPKLPVYTAWDIGFSDTMSIWYFQIENGNINIIEYNEFTGRSVAECCHIVRADWEGLEQKCGWSPSSEQYRRAVFQFGHHSRYKDIFKTHFGPHDLNHTEISIGVSRKSVAKQHGIDFKVVPKTDIASGIDLVRIILNRCFFDGNTCNHGIRGLKEYTKKKDEKLQIYKEKPLHDWASHPADSFRYLAQAVLKIDRNLGKQTSQKEADHRYDPLEAKARKYDKREEDMERRPKNRGRYAEALTAYNALDF